MIASCIVCGRELREVSPGYSENQPSDGVVAIINGNYGSTVFDPFDGTHLEVNVCDPCLVKAGEKGRVLSGRQRRPVTIDNLLIGYEELSAPLVQWHQGIPAYGDTCELHEEDLEEPLPKSIHIDPDALDAARKVINQGGW